MNTLVREKGGTFLLNKTEPIHRWYSYVEGYSSCLVTEELKKLLTLNPKIKTIYDPFCGTGTTALAFAGTMYNEDNLFQQRIPDQLWENIRTFIINLKNLPVWKDRSMAATIFGGKNKYDFWKIIFQTGKTSDGTQVLVVPLNVADMIKK